MRCVTFISVALGVLMALSVLAIAGKNAGRCPLCSADIAQHRHTAYVILAQSGKLTRYCDPRCGLRAHALRMGAVESARVRDLISGEWTDPAGMVFLFNSSASFSDSPGWLAFAERAEAVRFQKSFGGTLYTFDEALIERMRAGLLAHVFYDKVKSVSY